MTSVLSSFPCLQRSWKQEARNIRQVARGKKQEASGKWLVASSKRQDTKR